MLRFKMAARAVIFNNHSCSTILARILQFESSRKFSSLRHLPSCRKVAIVGRSFKAWKSNGRPGNMSSPITTARFMSTGGDVNLGTVLSEPDTVIVNITEQISTIEPTFSSLGLGGSSPIGLVQQAMEYVHIGVGLPWWATIVTTTLLFRTLMMPLVIKGQANAARLNNIKPQLDEFTQKMREVANEQDNMKKAEASRNLQNLFQKHNCHPFKSLIIPVVQIPLFISFFIGLRRMANLPVESMKMGGLLWFPDLTAADPFFILPILCSASMLLTIEAGAEAGVSNPQFKNIKHIFRIMAIMMIPLTAKFPTGIFTYWMTSNTFSLAQMIFLRIPIVRNLFGIPEMVDHSKTTSQTGGFIENLKAGYKNSQNLALIRHSEKEKEKAYEMATKQPIQQTFEKNPLSQRNEELFKISTKQKKRKRSTRDKYTNDM